ncbi:MULTISPECIES: septum formation initiator family protein [unclassified Rummeliibacillus]|uniref:FtsB family cell division protein n=1 Tax=unclassified Rummeliibacillus TaxID=2622809 RepID=UPI000E661992|nr:MULTISPECIES: septum formation initiator family protein [unclassified Rummeliibacillus]RIJ64327.1 septum formation initiator family protein [Rummeliibacillus sp. POC4]RPJ94655.1 septum formation initiator family protein [Rummeliibacillus sp. TYF005]
MPLTSKQLSKKTTQMPTDYAKTEIRKNMINSKRKIRLRRRLTVMTIIFALIAGSLMVMLIKQKSVLADKEKQKIELQHDLAKQKEKQDDLKIQIAKLKDDDYIAKLARKDLFLSEDGEIIFSIPKASEKDKKKTDSKE